MTDKDRNKRSDEFPDEEEDFEEEIGENQTDVPVTGDRNGVMDAPLDQVDMSDLVDLSDVEEMEDYADSLNPLDVLDVVDTDADEMAK